MTLEQLTQQLEQQPDSVEFSQVIELIDSLYTFMPTAFKNGAVDNQANENNGSCKLFAFGLIQRFNQEQMLSCFGHYYREDVLQHPDGNDHQNIRCFMQSGWDGIRFEQDALTAKS